MIARENFYQRKARLYQFGSRSEWRASRSRSPWPIGASTAAKICAGKECEAWLEAKLSRELDHKAKPWLSLGQCLESGILEAGRRIHGWALRDFSQTDTLAHPDLDWARATLDAERDDIEPGEPVNAKNVSFHADEFYDYRDGLMPQLHTLAGHWECFVTGAKRFHVLALVGGDGPEKFTIERDDDVIDGMLRTCAEFRDRYLIGDEEPEPDARDETRQALTARVNYDEGSEILFEGKVAEAALELTDLENEHKARGERIDELKNILRQAMATAKVGRAPNGAEWAWTEGKTRQFRRKGAKT